jgi:hypothetical protein
MEINGATKFWYQADSERYRVKFAELEQMIKFIGEWLEIDIDLLHKDEKIMMDIIDRTEKRRVYFWVFHKLHMGERNEIAVYIYWILKFRPFSYAGKAACTDKTNINVLIAAVWFIHMITYVSSKRGLKLKLRHDDRGEDFVDKLIYSFTYRDLSMESLMTMAESLLTREN